MNLVLQKPTRSAALCLRVLRAACCGNSARRDLRRGALGNRRPYLNQQEKMKNTVAILLLFCVVIGVGGFTRIIGFHYPRVIENQPLRNPIAIEKVDGSTITLSDGRILELESPGYNGRADGVLSVGSMIDIEECSPDEVIIWGNKPGWVCGTPWAQPIRIPLIADDVYRNRREMLSFATFKESKIKAQQVEATKRR